MRNSEEIDLRDGLVYDAKVKGFDSNFWHGDTANLLADTVRDAIKIGDTALVGSASSYSQYLFGDFEFNMLLDSVSPDSNDGASLSEGKLIGLRNVGDSLNRGAMYFEMRYDTVTGGDTTNTRPFRAVIYDEAGNKQQKKITWDTNWGGGGRMTKLRILWEQDMAQFLINDTVYATLGDRPDGQKASYQVNNIIPQALRISNRTADTTDTSSMAIKVLTIRNARKVI